MGFISVGENAVTTDPSVPPNTSMHRSNGIMANVKCHFADERTIGGKLCVFEALGQGDGVCQCGNVCPV